MNIISIVVLIFSVFGAINYLLDNKIGIGGKFERTFKILCPIALAMLGMLVIAPALGVWLLPVFKI